MKFLNNIDLQKNEIQNFRVQNLAAAPQNPVEGQHYYNTVDHIEYVWNGTEWINALSQGDYTFENGITEADRHVSLTAATNAEIGGVIVGTNIDVSAGTISVKDAAEGVKGVIAIASDAEVTTGTDTLKAVNVKQVANKIATAIEDKIELTDLSATAPITYDNGTGVISATFDDEPKADSPNLLKSGAIKTALDAKLDATEVPTKISDLEDDTATNPVDMAENIVGLTATATELNVLDGSTATTADLNKLHGVTADAAELNILDGATVTTEELNYLDGVTSAVQTQLDNKVTKNADITAGTHTKITYDAKGLVTAGANLEAGDIPDLSATYIPVSQKGTANGVATLDNNGLVPAAQLPSYVDDVVDLLTVAAEAPGECAEGDKYFNTTDKKLYTATGENTWDGGVAPEAGKIYVAVDTNMSYRWSGTTLVQIGADKLLGFNYTIVGDDTTSTFTVEHNLGTRNVVFEIYEAAAPYEKVYVQVLHTSTTALQVVFSQAPATGTNYNITVIAIG